MFGSLGIPENVENAYLVVTNLVIQTGVVLQLLD